MSAATRARLIAFAVLSAVGVVYVAGTYLGLVDRLLGRGYTVHVTLPASGGLFEGSEVTYRGVKIGRVDAMETTRGGVRVDVAVQDEVRLPRDSAVFVYNLSAIGEQYLDFQPDDQAGPYLGDGDTVAGSADSLPVDEADLLVELDQFVGSVDREDLRTFVRELGDVFEGTERPLETLIEDGGRFLDVATENTDETVRLLTTGLTVLRTQQAGGENIRSFSRDLAALTTALRRADGDLRTVLDDTPGAAREVEALLDDLGPTLPVLLSDLTTVNQTVVSHLAGVEQLLVTFPRVIAGGFTGTTPDGFGHVNLQFDNSVPPCTEGYKPRDQWRQGNELTDAPIFPARCTAGAPFVQRGTPNVPGTPNNPGPTGGGTSNRVATGTYDPVSGLVPGVVDRDGRPVEFAPAGDQSLMGRDSWQWLVVGPVVSP